MVDRQRSTLGALLYDLRSRKRFTLRELGDAAGVSGAYIGQIENSTPAKPLIPSLKMLRLIANGLGEGDADLAEEAYRQMGIAAHYFTDEMLSRGVVPAPPIEDDVESQSADTSTQSTIEVIVRLNPGSAGLSDEDKEFLARLAERSRVILRGEPDPGP